MEKKRIAIIWICCFMLLWSCKKDYQHYSGPEGVYFGVRYDGHINDQDGPYQSSTHIEFMKLGLQQMDLQIPVLITGASKSYDRVFKISVVADSTTAVPAVHYQGLNRQYIMPAYSNGCLVPLRLFCAPDLDTIERRLVLQLDETEDFVGAFSSWDPPLDITGHHPAQKFDATRHTIYLNNIMVKPNQWLGSVLENGEEFNALGAFTRRKMDFITERLGVSYADFASPSSMSVIRIGLISQQLSKILIERFNAGDPVLEEDGRLMYAGQVPWKSYVGIPWKK